MINNLYIDDQPARSQFGVWITRGGYSGLLAFPALKEPEANDWPEEDGVEVDLSDPKLERKEITLSLLADTNTAATDLVAYLSDPGYHRFRIPSLGREWRLRLAEHPENHVYPLQTAFSLKLVEDAPLRPGSENSQSFGKNRGDFEENLGSFGGNPGTFSGNSIRLPKSRYLLDDVPFSDYGVVIDVSHSALLKAPAAKLNLNRTVSTEDGQLYDADHLVFQKKEVTFNCHFKAVSMAAFWQCYDAFFAALIQPEERQLYVEEIGKAYPCYYKSCSSFEVLTLARPVIVKFNLTLVFTRFRLEGGTTI